MSAATPPRSRLNRRLLLARWIFRLALLALNAVGLNTVWWSMNLPLGITARGGVFWSESCTPGFGCSTTSYNSSNNDSTLHHGQVAAMACMFAAMAVSLISRIMTIRALTAKNTDSALYSALPGGAATPASAAPTARLSGLFLRLLAMDLTTTFLLCVAVGVFVHDIHTWANNITDALPAGADATLEMSTGAHAAYAAIGVAVVDVCISWVLNNKAQSEAAAQPEAPPTML